MNATYTDEITSIISNLRNNIYNSDDFLQTVTDNLAAAGLESMFSYEPAGGINIIIKANDIVSKTRTINLAITSAIRSANPNISIDDSTIYSLYNIVYAGNDSIMVKL
jgi:hypothetical protein